MSDPNKLKDLISVGQEFFFACPDDDRENRYWLKTLKVVKVGSKLVTLVNSNCFEEQAYLNNSQSPYHTHILCLKKDAGASVYGYKDEKTFNDLLEKKETVVSLNNKDWRKESKLKLDAILKILETTDESKIEDLIKQLS